MVQDAIQKADLLIEAMGWIRQFRDKITVIKLGGSVMEDAEALRHLLVDIVFMETVGMRPIVVHGGGAAITRAMEQAKIEPRATSRNVTRSSDASRITGLRKLPSPATAMRNALTGAGRWPRSTRAVVS